ncbi:ricin B-like lectin R40G3 [Tripterygium wilfordii]|uniref:ricin B-like lectin R40G3 n=1 Tax=Tripterygium wilfordii TaxID=458696 RepID=UPI0018F8291E|nr:ricin B-like lectin R40G3 [Tripterygium wilfordii]
MGTTMAETNLSYRVYYRASPDYNLAIGEGMAILVAIDENDDRQHWYKDDKYSYMKDKYGYAAFSLVNEATGQTLKHSFDHPLPVKLVTYNPDVLEESVLWAHADDCGEGYRAIRSLKWALHLEAAALTDSSYYGAIIIGGLWIDGNNQQWKIEHHRKKYRNHTSKL